MSLKYRAVYLQQIVTCLSWEFDVVLLSKATQRHVVLFFSLTITITVNPDLNL